jgi:hypothetical protein
VSAAREPPEALASVILAQLDTLAPHFETGAIAAIVGPGDVVGLDGPQPLT